MLKFILGLVLVFSSLASATQRGEPGLRGPVGTVAYLDTSTTNVTSAAWVTFVASMPFACSTILIQNTGASVIQIGIGAAAAEVSTGMFIPTGSQAWMLPIQFARANRISLKAMAVTQSTGTISMSCFQ